MKMIDLERDLLASGSSFRWLHIQSILLVLRSLVVLSPLCHLIRDHVPQIAKTAFDTVEEGADGEKAPESRVRVCLQKHSRGAAPRNHHPVDQHLVIGTRQERV